MDIRLATVREIDVAATTLWDLVSDTARYAEWVPLTAEVVRTDGRAALGSTYTERSVVVGPITAPAEWEVIEYQEGSWQRHRCTSIPFLKPLDVTVEVEELAEARSRLTLGWEGRTALGPLGLLFVKLQKKSFARDLEKTADNMAEAARRAAR